MIMVWSFIGVPLTTADLNAGQADAADQEHQDADENGIAGDIGTGADADGDVFFQRFDILSTDLALGLDAELVVANGDVDGRTGDDIDRDALAGVEGLVVSKAGEAVRTTGFASHREA